MNETRPQQAPGQARNVDMGQAPTASQTPKKSGGGWLWKTLGIIVLLAIIAAGAYYFLGGGNAVATVNGEDITRSEFNTRLEQARAQVAQGNTDTTDPAIEEQLRAQVLEALINEALLLQEAAEAGVSVTAAEVDTVLAQNRDAFETEAEYEQALQTQGFTESSFRDFLETQLTIRAYAEQELGLSTLSATQAELEQLYTQATEGVEDPPALEDVRPQLEAQVIQQKSQLLLAQLIEQLRTESTIETTLE